MKDKPLFCPINREPPFYCDRERCAWWGNERCSMVIIAVSLFNIERCLETIATNSSFIGRNQ